jgi:hypothetical protein
LFIYLNEFFFVFLCFCVFVFLCFCVFVFLCFCVFVFLCFLCFCICFECYLISFFSSTLIPFIFSLSFSRLSVCHPNQLEKIHSPFLLQALLFLFTFHLLSWWSIHVDFAFYFMIVVCDCLFLSLIGISFGFDGVDIFFVIPEILSLTFSNFHFEKQTR